MSKGASQSRRQRRGQFRAAGYLKIKNMYGRFSEQGRAWYDKMAADGKAAHEAHVDRVQENIEHNLQIKLDSLKETWSSIGYNEDEIKKLEEAFAIDSIKNKESYREDRKESKKLRKEAQLSLQQRLNADG